MNMNLSYRSLIETKSTFDYFWVHQTDARWYKKFKVVECRSNFRMLRWRSAMTQKQSLQLQALHLRFSLSVSVAFEIWAVDSRHRSSDHQRDLSYFRMNISRCSHRQNEHLMSSADADCTMSYQLLTHLHKKQRNISRIWNLLTRTCAEQAWSLLASLY